MHDEELMEISPEVRSVLSTIMSMFSTSIGQGILDANRVAHTAFTEFGGPNFVNSAVNAVSAVNGIVPVNNDEPIQQDDDILDVINALVDHINSVPPTNENDDVALSDDILNVNDLTDVNGVDEIPLYLVLLK